MSLPKPARNPEPHHLLKRVSGVGTSVIAGKGVAQVESQGTVQGLVRREFTAFYAECYPPVARALGITLGDGDLGAEAADEAMARCYSHWSKVQSYDNPAGWVYRVGLNWATSMRRRLAGRLAAEGFTSAELPAIPDPDVHRALMSLDSRQRSVVVCRFLLDWSVQQTADALDIRPGTVKSRTSRALELLENKLYHLRQEG